jgi:hypothetical protein
MVAVFYVAVCNPGFVSYHLLHSIHFLLRQRKSRNISHLMTFRNAVALPLRTKETLHTKPNVVLFSVETAGIRSYVLLKAIPGATVILKLWKIKCKT